MKHIHFPFNCASCVCVVHFFCISTFDGFVAHVWVDTYHFVIVSRTLLPCSPMCLCVGWLNVSLVLGAIHHIVIVWGCVCVLSVCMSCVHFCGDVVEVFAFARLCVCVGVVQPKSTPDEKTKQTHRKARKDTSTQKSKKTKNMKTTVTTTIYGKNNHETRNHENTETRKDKIMKQTTWATHTHRHTMKTLRKHNIKINPKE